MRRPRRRHPQRALRSAEACSRRPPVSDERRRTAAHGRSASTLAKAQENAGGAREKRRENAGGPRRGSDAWPGSLRATATNASSACGGGAIVMLPSPEHATWSPQVQYSPCPPGHDGTSSARSASFRSATWAAAPCASAARGATSAVARSNAERNAGKAAKRVIGDILCRRSMLRYRHEALSAVPAKYGSIISRARRSAQCTYRAAKRRGGFTPFLGNAKPGA